MPSPSTPKVIEPDRLIVANSEICANLYYATHFFAPDVYAWARVKGKTAVLLSPLEVDRGRALAQVDRVDALDEFQAQAAKVPSLDGVKDYAHTLGVWLSSLGANRNLEVPADFPLQIAQRLQTRRYRLHPIDEPFWPEREVKHPPEIDAMRQALRITEAGMARGFEVLRAARIGKKGELRWRGELLDSETLRAEIDMAVLRAGGHPAHTIVAGGEQACDPHERGTGALRAGELIILDIFPRDGRTGFYGDLTRTVVRGQARPELQALWETCLEGQKIALREVKPGRHGRTIHQKIVRYFAKAGYPTGQANGRWQGFFHGTGHGLGLEVHEYPRFATTKFRCGQVLTVEPGIYWPGVGGVRHEDVILVCREGVQMLSDFPKPFLL